MIITRSDLCGILGSLGVDPRNVPSNGIVQFGQDHVFVESIARCPEGHALVEPRRTYSEDGVRRSTGTAWCGICHPERGFSRDGSPVAELSTYMERIEVVA